MILSYSIRSGSAYGRLPIMSKDQTPQVFSRAHDRTRHSEGRHRYLLEPRVLEGLSGAEIDVRKRCSDMHPRPDAVL
jgi:hypothetical protein